MLMNWKEAPQDQVVCAETGKTKQDVVQAIALGAETVEALEEEFGPCGASCSCREDLQALLNIYLPLLQEMRGAGTCDCGGACGGGCEA
jgi:NAD(P)H-nitrite reductase large subunit